MNELLLNSKSSVSCMFLYLTWRIKDKRAKDVDYLISILGEQDGAIFTEMFGRLVQTFLGCLYWLFLFK